MPAPFEVTAAQVVALKAAFTPFMNQLLETERAAQGTRGHQLSLNWNETVGDGGVDADYDGAAGSEWVPAGHSVWQFKSGKIQPKEAAVELETATEARECLQAGGSYIVLIGGQALPENLIKRRRKALVDKAIALGDIQVGEEDRIRVYDANKIARWATTYPAMTVSHVLRAPAAGAIDYAAWTSSPPHQLGYSYDGSRTESVNDLRDRLADAEVVQVRIQGESGFGKTRLAMEALSDERFNSLVAYVDDERKTQAGIIEAMVADGREGIIVVDECPADRHVKLVEKLRVGAAIKIVTIGDLGPAATSGGVLGVAQLDDDAMDDLLQRNFPAMQPEARRLIRDNAGGNPRWAILAADAIKRAPDTQVVDLIATGDLGAFVAAYLPQGKTFFVSAVLALFERVGWDRDLRAQKELVASFAGVDVTELDDAELALAERGLIHQQGRYRAIAPAPFALYLAAEGWKQHGARVLDELVPQLNEEMVLALFRRLAQLGRYEPGLDAVAGLLGPTGPFSTLERIEASGLGALLTQLAIVAPDQVAPHLSELIEAADVTELARFTRSRRDLVWTLEKLAWHTRTFELAANALLRLGLGENETYANNATGTWVELFGGRLPGTAATPVQRATYLRRVAADADPHVRLFAVSGAAKPMSSHESITVSGEVQGGVLVEPRGAPQTWVEFGDYRRDLLNILDQLRKDPESEVSAAATKALLGALHPLIDDPLVSSHLANILVGFTGDSLRELRVDIEHLISLYTRHDTNDRNLLEPLTLLRDRLPAATAAEEVQALLQMSRWDLEQGELGQRLTDAVEALGPQGRLDLLEVLATNLPAAWEFGQALGRVDGETDELLDRLTGAFDTNPSALLGYLVALADAGDNTAFDRYLDSPRSQPLTARERLGLATRGPDSQQARDRIRTALAELPVHEAAPASFGWHRNLSNSEIAELVTDWTARIESQDDYNALVDWVNLVLHGVEQIPAELYDPTWDLLALRSQFPNLAHQAWDWAHLADAMVHDHGVELITIILDEIESGQTMIHSGDDDTRILQSSLKAHPDAGWADLARRLGGPDSWRLPMQLRGWIQFSVPHAIIDSWVSTDLDRARLVADMTSAGGEDPTELASMLLDRFADDEQIRSSLAAGFLSGGWMGPYSERVAGQLAQMTAWRTRADLPHGVRRWAGEMVESLTADLARAREREAERGY